MIENDMCIRLTPVYDDGAVVTMREDVVITKEEFIACYNARIKENKE